MTATQSDLVIGVAGHIDHGKTALVKALTGVDTDRLPEEKARGITIELGFAALELDHGGVSRRAAVIDMPGHERFVRTMIAGAGGVDVLMLVVAANEGVMPQTREHLAIAELVGVRGGVCVLSKTDLAGDMVELATEEVREVLQGTVLEHAPVVAVSAFTGEGLGALRAELARVAVPARDASGALVLGIDRVFVRRGFGVVVTGTLVSGTVREGEALLVGPLGPDQRVRDVRVRGLQVHGAAVGEARAGTRLAVNLAGIEVADVPRGAWLFRPGEVVLSRAFDAELVALPQTRRALGRRAKLEVAVGTTHALASVALLEGEGLEPGGRALARIRTDRALVVRHGERMVLRGPPSLAGVGSTVGGCTVVRPAVERVRKRVVALERARRAREGDAQTRAVVELEAVGARGLTRAELCARTGFRVEDPTDASTMVAVAVDRWVARSVMDALERALLETLSAFHGKNPGERGVGRRALVSLGDDVLVDAALARLLARASVTRDGDVIARAGWKPRGADDVPHLAGVRDLLARAGVAPPRVDEMASALGATGRDVEAALRRLVERKDVVKVSPDLWMDSAALEALEARLVAYLEAHGTIDAQGFKDLTGQTRKFAIPLAEYFDLKKLTLRIGDRRKLRGR